MNTADLFRVADRSCASDRAYSTPLPFISLHALPLCTPPKWLVDVILFSFQQGCFGSHDVERIASGTCDGGDISLALTMIENHEKIGAISGREGKGVLSLLRASGE